MLLSDTHLFSTILQETCRLGKPRTIMRRIYVKDMFVFSEKF